MSLVASLVPSILEYHSLVQLLHFLVRGLSAFVSKLLESFHETVGLNELVGSFSLRIKKHFRHVTHRYSDYTCSLDTVLFTHVVCLGV